MRKDVERFIQKRLSKNEGFVQAYRDELKALKGGQSPECYVLMCGDSRCAETSWSGEKVELGEVFGGPATMGNVVNDAVLATLAFNVDHLKTKFFVVCGHTGCGAVKASMADFSSERAILKNELEKLKADYMQVQAHSQLSESDTVTLNVARNVQAQVLKVLQSFEMEVASGQLTVLGAICDNQGVWGDEGRLYFTSINGEDCFVKGENK